MKVALDVGDARAWLGNNGITLVIRDNDGSHFGKLRIGRATVEWCPGKTRMGNGKRFASGAFWWS